VKGRSQKGARTLRNPNSEIAEFLEWLRRQGHVAAGSGVAFDRVLALVEYIAGREELIRAPERELEPDALARRFMSDAEELGLRRVSAIIEGLTPEDLGRVENILLTLEKKHGRILTNPPSHRLLLDAAVLGQVGYVYSRKFREVLTTHLLSDGSLERGLLPNLTAGVDALFSGEGRRYLWRLGPEFGTDRNVVHLLQRGDDFIVRSLYPTRAQRLARDVAFWETAGDYWIGEYCLEPLYPFPVRTLVLRWRSGRGWAHGLLVSNLFNTPWERILQLHQNRACKYASIIDISDPIGFTGAQKVAASLLILALFTFRNVRSWATEIQQATTISSSSEQAQRSPVYVLERLSSIRRDEIFDHMGIVVSHLISLTGREGLEGVTPSLEPTGYIVEVTAGTTVATPAAGTVIYVDPPDQEAGRTVIIDHGAGFSTVHRFLDSVAADLVVGARLEAGDPIGQAGEFVHFEPRMSYQYIAGGNLPSVATLLAANTNLVLDPLGVLAQGVAETESFEAEYLGADGTIGADDLMNTLVTHTDDTSVGDTAGDFEVVQLEGPDLGVPIAFLVNRIDSFIAFDIEEILTAQDIDLVEDDEDDVAFTLQDIS